MDQSGDGGMTMAQSSFRKSIRNRFFSLARSTRFLVVLLILEGIHAVAGLMGIDFADRRACPVVAGDRWGDLDCFGIAPARTKTPLAGSESSPGHLFSRRSCSHRPGSDNGFDHCNDSDGADHRVSFDFKPGSEIRNPGRGRFEHRSERGSGKRVPGRRDGGVNPTSRGEPDAGRRH